MTVSIVVPLHDAAGTVAATIASVRAQSFEDWELIVVDDASTDGGPDVAREAAAGLGERFRLLASPSRTPTGPAAARNRGLAVAAGEQVAFLDADDRWAPGFLDLRLDELGSGAAMAWGPSRYWYPDDPQPAEHIQETGRPDALRRLAPAEPLAGWLWQLRWTPCPSAVLLRRDVVEAVGGFPDLRRAEDVALWIAVATDHPTVYDPEPLTWYRRHAESSTARSRRAGTTGSDDLAFGRWAVGWVGGHPGLRPLRALAARTLHGLAHRIGGGPVHVRIVTTQAVLGTPGARHRWWAVVLDWLLPLPWSRRLAARLDRVRVDR